MCRDFNGYHSGGISFVYVNDLWLSQKLFVYHRYNFSSEKKKKKVKSPRCMVSHPEIGSDSPIGSDRESGRDTIAICEITNRKVKNDIKSVFVYVSFTFHRYYKGIILINA